MLPINTNVPTRMRGTISATVAPTKLTYDIQITAHTIATETRVARTRAHAVPARKTRCVNAISNDAETAMAPIPDAKQIRPIEVSASPGIRPAPANGIATADINTRPSPSSSSGVSRVRRHKANRRQPIVPTTSTNTASGINALPAISMLPSRLSNDSRSDLRSGAPTGRRSRALLQRGGSAAFPPYSGGNHSTTVPAESMEELADNLWAKERPLRFLGVETGTRMTVVRLSSGGLFVHSPGPLDPELRALIGELGPVVAVVAPSLFHHLCAGEWKDAYPEARLFACPGLERKRADLAWDGVLGDDPEEPWRGEIDQVFFGARTMENEVVFFHGASRTLICCDILFNLSKHPSPLTRLVALLLGNRRPGATWLEGIMIRDRTSARSQIDRMLAWDIDRIVLSHGEMVPSDGREVLRRAYDWL